MDMFTCIYTMTRKRNVNTFVQEVGLQCVISLHRYKKSLDAKQNAWHSDECDIFE